MPRDARCIITTCYENLTSDVVPHYPRDRPSPPASTSSSSESKSLSEVSDRDALALADGEINDFLDLYGQNSIWSRSQGVKDALSAFSNGHGGVLRQGVDYLYFLETCAGKTMKDYSQETTILQFQDPHFMSWLERRFGVPSSFSREDADIISDAILRRIMGFDVHIDATELPEDDPHYRLWRCGVLTKSGQFTSRAAQQFYYAKIFPRP